MEITEIIGYATAAVTIASIVAAVTPTPRDDQILGKLYRIIDGVALNVGKAKDKPPGK